MNRIDIACENKARLSLSYRQYPSIMDIATHPFSDRRKIKILVDVERDCMRKNFEQDVRERNSRQTTVGFQSFVCPSTLAKHVD